MTLEQKNFILGFLRISKINKELDELEEKTQKEISEIINLLPKEERKKGFELENNFVDFAQSVKWHYFDYGIYAEETAEDWNLNWTPQEYKKEVRKNDIK